MISGEHLGLVLQPAEGPAVHDAIAIAGELVAIRIMAMIVNPTTALAGG
jgi:hypothetical protein